MSDKKERALLATDLRGIAIILATDSSQIAFDVSELSSSAEEIGLCDPKDCPEPGLYLWTGTHRMVVHGAPWDGCEPELEYDGIVRPVRPDEVADLYAMESPCFFCGATPCVCRDSSE